MDQVGPLALTYVGEATHPAGHASHWGRKQTLGLRPVEQRSIARTAFFGLLLRTCFPIQIVGNFEQSGTSVLCHTTHRQVAAYAGGIV